VSNAGARECSACGKLAVVWSVARENLGGEVDVGAVIGGIGCNIALGLSESSMQGGKSDGKGEEEAWEAHGCMWIWSCICVRNVPIQLMEGIGTRWMMCYKPYLWANSTRCFLIFS
jgi:hypothetical protein